MPVIEISRRMPVREDAVEALKRPEGIVADVPDEDGVYTTSTSTEASIEVEMDPPESSDSFFAIALTSALFIGHERGAGYVGAERRVVQLSKKRGTGSIQLSSNEVLKVSLHQ